MRKLSDEFLRKLDGEFKPIIEFVKENEDVFLGIRNDYINLYVDGGNILKIERVIENSTECYKASFDKNYYDTEEKQPSSLKKLNEKNIQNINEWIEILPILKQRVKEYQRKTGNCKYTRCIKKEKIIQQKLLHAFNKDSNYFAYDIEYEVEGALEYLKDFDGNPIKKPKTIGRADILLISLPNENNEICIYSMEVKQGSNAFGGVNDGKKEKPNKDGKIEDKRTLGSGVVGHIKNNVKIIKSVRTDKPYINEINKKKLPLRQIMLEEVKSIMSLYEHFGLIENKKFKNIDWKNITLKQGDKAMELVFFLGNLKERSKSFEHYLGIDCEEDKEAKYSLRKLLLDEEAKRNLNLEFMTYEEMIDEFKVKKTEKTWDDEFDLDELNIENYDVIKKEKFKANT